ncbi:MAG: alpha/beta fold hydrolase, partial [Acidobacteria bacterium]|nr:alpha/beta fold hydrolase [Acidobacteriota bacterium]
ISAPTLIVWGDGDAVVSRADQDALADAIEGAELRVYSGVGHSPHWEEPQWFASDLTAFIRALEMH